MIRIWSGCALTAARKNRLDPSSDPSCSCGAESQTVHHLVFDCPHVSPPSQQIREWGLLPPAFSSALLCPLLPMPSQVATWREVCKRALATLTLRINASQRHDWRGHTPVIDASGQVAFCTRCYTSRKTRDQSFIASEPCRGPLLGAPCGEGDYIRMQGRILRCVMLPWKRASTRPGFMCVQCESGAWPRVWAEGRGKCRCHAE